VRDQSAKINGLKDTQAEVLFLLALLVGLKRPSILENRLFRWPNRSNPMGDSMEKSRRNVANAAFWR
jgi:hypothetical protein